MAHRKPADWPKHLPIIRCVAEPGYICESQAGGWVDFAALTVAVDGHCEGRCLAVVQSIGGIEVCRQPSRR